MPQPPEPQAAGTTAPPASTPPWGDDANFDPAKAWSLIEGLKADKARLAARPTLTDEQKTQLAEYEKTVQASKTELDRTKEEATRWQTEAQRWRTSTVTARIEALAAPQFEYPADAVGKLDPAKYLDAGGQIDETAIRADLEQVLKERPSWARSTAAGPRVPAPNRSQGTSGSGGAPSSPADAFAQLLQGKLSN